MKDFIWYEKYRPKELSDLVLPSAHKKAFKRFIKAGEIPHLLFHGPAGSGKTSISKILISHCSSAALILNASAEDRGIGAIKKKVKQFASSVRRGKLKVVFFDEANGLTADAQEALKNTIEKYQSNCRFVFTTNELDKITPPILSRCQLFKFDSMPQDDLLEYLEGVLDEEEIKYKSKKVKEIIKMYYPDVRTIMNCLQACSISGKFDIKQVITTLDTKMMKLYLDKGKIFALRHMFAGASDFLWVYKWLFNDYVWSMDKEARGDAALVVADYLNRDRGIADKEINLSACCLELMDISEVEIDFSEPF